MKKVIAKQTKQIEVYEGLLKALKDIKPVIEKFNGKQLNVRLENALEEVIGSRLNVSLKNNQYSNRKEIRIANFNNRNYPNPTGSGTCYVDYYESTLTLSQEMALSKKLDSTEVMELIDKEIKRLENRIAELTKGIENLDKMMAEYKAIQKQIDEFEKAYDYSIINDAKCIFKR